MKSLIFAAAMLIAAAVPATAQIHVSAPRPHVDVNVSVNVPTPRLSIGGTGFYGVIDIGGYGRPTLYSPRPIIIERSSYAQPMYLRVPPGHRNKWSKHCSRYNACGHQVYFVQDSWYSNHYAPQYRQRHGGGRDHGYNDNRGHKSKGHRGNDYDDDRGRGRGNGKHDKHDKHDKHGRGNGHGKH